jgi:purine-binding chemotaxis protein CheW
MSAVHVQVRVGGETYALPVDNVLEVGELGSLTPVPGAPNACIGVRNLRGEVVPVFDLAAVLGLPRDGVPARLVVAEEGARRAGLAIDDVTDIGAIPEPSEESESDFLIGGALADGALVGVLDVPRLFATLEREDVS